MLPLFLRAGYQNFRKNRYSLEQKRYRTLALKQQSPQVMVIACCDSRTAPEIIFDASPGELFVVRNVANIVPPYAPDGKHHSTSAALEFAVLGLHVSHILVMGHGRCGGIAALVDAPTPLSHGDFIGQWMASLSPVLANIPSAERGKTEKTRIEQAAVVHSLKNLETFPWIARRIEEKELFIHGAWFDIAVGQLWGYDPHLKIWQAEA